mmetsp:Transcript_5050/g.14345  ORF Transcript_5050/g.14345 Transcript_5050/m.14345 type:complete len:353 (-) Transcript_5050:128-1186(-)
MVLAHGVERQVANGNQILRLVHVEDALTNSCQGILHVQAGGHLAESLGSAVGGPLERRTRRLVRPQRRQQHAIRGLSHRHRRGNRVELRRFQVLRHRRHHGRLPQVQATRPTIWQHRVRRRRRRNVPLVHVLLAETRPRHKTSCRGGPQCGHRAAGAGVGGLRRRREGRSLRPGHFDVVAVLRALARALGNADLHPLHATTGEKLGQLVVDEDVPPKVLGELFGGGVHDREQRAVNFGKGERDAAFATDHYLAPMRPGSGGSGVMHLNAHDITPHRHQCALVQPLAGLPGDLLEITKVGQVAIGLQGATTDANGYGVVVAMQWLAEATERHEVRRRELHVLEGDHDLPRLTR